MLANPDHQKPVKIENATVMNLKFGGKAKILPSTLGEIPMKKMSPQKVKQKLKETVLKQKATKEANRNTTQVCLKKTQTF